MFKTNAFYSVIIIVIAFTILSCSNSNTTEPVIETYLQPLDVGNYWIYHFNTIDDTLRYEVVEEIDINVDGVNKLVSKIAMANLNYYLFNDNDGFHYIHNYSNRTREDSLSDFSVFQYKYPVEINDTWFQDYRNDGLTSEYNVVDCISTNIIINCPAGDFECIAYRINSSESNDDNHIEYYCPGVGLVKSRIYIHETNSFQERSLVQYHVQE